MRRGPFARSLPPLFLAAAAALLLLLDAGAAFDPAYNPHAHFRSAGACPKCHVYSGGMQVTDRFRGDSTDYCFGCHSKEALGRSHPIGVRPTDRASRIRIPADLALDDRGRMMCLTCHDAHGPFVSTVKAFATQKPENPDRSPGTPLYYRTGFVRRTDPGKGYAVLCDGCHENP